MLFWIVAGTMAALVAALLARPLLAPPATQESVSPDQAIYRDQLAEVERDLQRGVIAPPEAERARVEIARRLLAADRAGPLRMAEAPRWAALAGAAAAAVLVVLGGLLLYSTLGRPGVQDLPRAARLAEAERVYAERPIQAEAEATVPAPATPEPPPDVAATIEELRRAAASEGADPQTLRFLVEVEGRLGRFAEAARAQERLVALLGEAAGTDDHAFLLDFMVAAAGGQVTPEAEAVLARMAEEEPGHPAVRYYAGLLHATTRRPDLAFPFWRALVEEAPPEDRYRRMAEAGVEDLAWLAGVDYEAPPTSDAGASDPAAQQEMIRGMVDGLASRLASQGGPVEDWARLVTSLGVLGEREQAEAILSEARGVFDADTEAGAVLDRAAQDAGLAP